MLEKGIFEHISARANTWKKSFKVYFFIYIINNTVSFIYMEGAEFKFGLEPANRIAGPVQVFYSGSISEVYSVFDFPHHVTTVLGLT